MAKLDNFLGHPACIHSVDPYRSKNPIRVFLVIHGDRVSFFKVIQMETLVEACLGIDLEAQLFLSPRHRVAVG